MGHDPNGTVNGRSRCGPGPVNGRRGDMPPGRLRADAPDHPADSSGGAMRRGGGPLRRPRCTVSCTGPDGETDDRTELNPLSRGGRSHGRWRFRRGGTVGGLGDRRDGDQHQGARGQDAASGRTGQLGLRNRPGALARIPRRCTSAP
jgi:hypothetical protein